MFPRTVRAWRDSRGQVSWPLFATFAVAEAAALWVVWIVFGSRLGLLPQILVLCIGLVGWLALGRDAATKRPLVPIPELSVSRMPEIKRAWSFVALLYVPLLVAALSVILIALLVLDLGGGLFWCYVTGVPSQALWNSNTFRSKYVRYIWGSMGAHAPST
jgi:hypothetical protein